jgi:hypothetical protein
MWKSFFDLFRQVLMVTEDTQRNRAEIKDLREQVQALSLTVQKLVSDSERRHDNERHEREKLLLQLKTELLQFERRLLLGKTEPDQK